MCSRTFETPSLPSSLAATHRGFAFYVAFPKLHSTSRFAHLWLLASPPAPCSLLPSSLYLLCSARSSLGEGGSLIPFAPFGDVMANEQSRKGIFEIEGKVARVATSESGA